LVVVIRNRFISGKKVYDMGEDIASGMLQEELLQTFQIEKINEPIILGNKYSLMNPLFD
jgi:hypothetical protein